MKFKKGDIVTLLPEKQLKAEYRKLKILADYEGEFFTGFRRTPLKIIDFSGSGRYGVRCRTVDGRPIRENNHSESSEWLGEFELVLETNFLSLKELYNV